MHWLTQRISINFINNTDSLTPIFSALGFLSFLLLLLLITAWLVCSPALVQTFLAAEVHLLTPETGYIRQVALVPAAPMLGRPPAAWRPAGAKVIFGQASSRQSRVQPWYYQGALAITLLDLLEGAHCQGTMDDHRLTRQVSADLEVGYIRMTLLDLPLGLLEYKYGIPAQMEDELRGHGASGTSVASSPPLEAR